VVRYGGDNTEREDAPAKKTTQAVLSMTMKDFREICEAYEIRKGVIPDRDGYQEDEALKLMLETVDGGSA
jgi:hypothetical protein